MADPRYDPPSMQPLKDAELLALFRGADPILRGRIADERRRRRERDAANIHPTFACPSCGYAFDPAAFTVCPECGNGGLDTLPIADVWRVLVQMADGALQALDVLGYVRPETGNEVVALRTALRSAADLGLAVPDAYRRDTLVSKENMI